MRLSVFGGVLLAAGFVAALSPSAFAASGSVQSIQQSDIHASLDLDSLHLSTFTDTLPGTAATEFHALAGDTVRRVYVVRNDGLLPLTDVSVHDPEVSQSAIRCTGDGDDDADDSDLGPLSWLSCSVTFKASAGEHDSRVAATALSPVFGSALSAEAATGYTAIAPGLSASVALANGVPPGGNVPAGAAIGATVRIVNSGSAELTGLRLAPPPSLSGLSCPGGSAIGSLEPGESAVCSGSLTTAAGRHDDPLLLAGAWRWDRAITSEGPQPTRSYPIQTTVDVAYAGVNPPPCPSPSPRPRSAAVLRPPAASPLPASPTPPTPSPPRRPVSTPIQALAPATVQFVASRGLSLPLKVLAIVIIPVVAAGRRIASRK